MQNRTFAPHLAVSWSPVAACTGVRLPVECRIRGTGQGDLKILDEQTDLRMCGDTEGVAANSLSICLRGDAEGVAANPGAANAKDGAHRGASSGRMGKGWPAVSTKQQQAEPGSRAASKGCVSALKTPPVGCSITKKWVPASGHIDCTAAVHAWHIRRLPSWLHSGRRHMPGRCNWGQTCPARSVHWCRR
jgi:hypothetical protein